MGFEQRCMLSQLVRIDELTAVCSSKVGTLIVSSNGIKKRLQIRVCLHETHKKIMISLSIDHSSPLEQIFSTVFLTDRCPSPSTTTLTLF